MQGGRSIRGQADCADGSEVGLASGPEDPTNPSQEIMETGEGALGFLPPERKPLVEQLGDERCRGMATEGQHRPPEDVEGRVSVGREHRVVHDVAILPLEAIIESPSRLRSQ